MDYVELPDGYGHGSSTLKHWISANLEKDRATQRPPQPASAAVRILYENDFEAIEVGIAPKDFMVLNGEFAVQSDGTNKFLELPGAPLDSFAAQFGPAEGDNVAVRARILGTARGRRGPTFGVGLGGVAGFKLQVSPGKKAVEILRDQESKITAPFDWRTGEWTHLHLQLRKEKDGRWQIQGKAWQGAQEPQDWTVVLQDDNPPIAGRASVLGSPFSGTPIRFDDLKVKSLTGSEP